MYRYNLVTFTGRIVWSSIGGIGFHELYEIHQQVQKQFGPIDLYMQPANEIH
jgi:hypothetical protein